MTIHISPGGVGRHACPFYGFFMTEEIPILMDQQGNQCPLIRGSYSPCQMETRGQTPNWNDCPFNNEENREVLERIASSYKVAPKELWPKGESTWGGIPFKEWEKRVMGE